MYSIQSLHLLAVLSAIMYVPIRSYAEDPLVLDYQIEQREVVERCPLVTILTVRNVSDSTVKTIFPQRGPHVYLAERAGAVVEDQEGRTYALSYRGGLRSELTAPIADHPMRSGGTRTIQRLFSLIVLAPAPARWAGRIEERFRFLEPGRYTGHFEVALLHGKTLVSDKFSFTILEAEGVNAEAREKVGFEHAAFLEGRDKAPDESYYRGGKWWKKVDVSRFGELQKIVDDYPNSTYAEWIRFWKVYHHAPVDDAIEYAREHREFPLSDNLMLRAAERLFNKAGKHDRATFNRVRELAAELLRDFPDGDTRASVMRLQQKLTKKP